MFGVGSRGRNTSKGSHYGGIKVKSCGTEKMFPIAVFETLLGGWVGREWVLWQEPTKNLTLKTCNKSIEVIPECGKSCPI